MAAQVVVHVSTGWFWPMISTYRQWHVAQFGSCATNSRIASVSTNPRQQLLDHHHSWQCRSRCDLPCGVVPIPTLRAVSAACARSDTPSLVRMSETWLATVRGESPSRRPIRPLARPSAAARLGRPMIS